MKNLSWKNFRKYFLSYIPALLILGLGSSLINVVLKIKKRMDEQLHRNVAGIDALVGAKGSPIQLTLANIYHLDDPTGNISLQKAIALSKNPMLANSIPLAYGDNLKGFKILGTTIDYIKNFGASLKKGKYITEPLEVVIGSDVAKKLKVDVGFSFYSVHGSHDGHEHKENEYHVVGILEENNSVIDKLILTSIASFWKTHNLNGLENYYDSSSFIVAKNLNKKLNKTNTITSNTISKEKYNTLDHTHNHKLENDHEHENHDTNPEENNTNKEKEITALLLKFRGPAGFFLVNQINSDTELMAINPAQTVLKFFTVLGIGYETVESIGIGVILVSIITLMLTLIQVFQGRKQELALLRVMGASKAKIVRTMLGEVLLIVVFGFLIGFILTFGTIEILSVFIEQGIFNGFEWNFFGKDELRIFLVCLLCGMVSVSIPLIKTYRIDISKTLANES